MALLLFYHLIKQTVLPATEPSAVATRGRRSRQAVCPLDRFFRLPGLANFRIESYALALSLLNRLRVDACLPVIKFVSKTPSLAVIFIPKTANCGFL
jgi:hypothetical protein